MNELIGRQTIAHMVAAYKTGRTQLVEAYSSIREAKGILKSSFGGKGLWKLDLDIPDNEDKALKCLLISAWEYVINQTGVRQVMTQERTDEVKQQLEDGDLPPFTGENVMAMIDHLRGDLNIMMEESVKEVFEWLRPHPHGKQGYKTNTEFEVGKKAIMSRVFDMWGSPSSKYYHISVDEQNAMLNGLDNVFHLLDEKRIPEYPNDLKTKVKEAHKTDDWSCETEYFKCKWYKKGSFHIEFKRMDLVAKLNQIAGGARLKPAGV